MASTSALIGPKSCEAASPASLPRPSDANGMTGDTPSLDFISSSKSILRLREINEYPFFDGYSWSCDRALLHAGIYICKNNL